MSTLIANKFVVINNFVCDIGKFKNFPKNKIKNKNLSELHKNKALNEPFFNTKTKKEEIKTMTEKEIKDSYPNIYDKIEEEAIRKERERIKAIDEISDNLPKDLIMEAKYTSCISASELAFKALKENKILCGYDFSDVIADNAESNVKDVNLLDNNKGEKEKIANLVNSLNKGGIK